MYICYVCMLRMYACYVRYACFMYVHICKHVLYVRVCMHVMDGCVYVCMQVTYVRADGCYVCHVCIFSLLLAALSSSALFDCKTF